MKRSVSQEEKSILGRRTRAAREILNTWNSRLKLVGRVVDERNSGIHRMVQPDYGFSLADYLDNVAVQGSVLDLRFSPKDFHVRVIQDRGLQL